ncbi:glycosyltransferase family 2 protein [Salinibacter ruber]|uniref:glycosyltransferase family 2 protein n=1 Tax=Salinibacter ruber TaxID=146919 RepID=UPI002168EF62|nr:glycosyltransferase family 2 protein [Salinibacter ruber]
MSTPTLALCIPAYNASGHLPRLLASAQEQTVDFDEILVYDDCSTDNTAEVARSYGAEVITGETNQGCTVGRKRLAEHASADWLHFHDADDMLYPNFVEQAQKWMQRDSPPDVVVFSYEERREATDEKIDVRHFDAEALRADPIEYTIRTVINPFCGLYRRDAFLETGGPDTDPDVHYNEDAAMHCKLARAGLRFDADPTVTVVNYHREDSMSQSNLVKCERARYHVLKKCARFNGDTHGPTIAHQLWKLAGILASRGEWAMVDKSARLAVRLGGRVPSHGGALFRILGAVHPQTALRIRERLIRLFKPSLREA